MNGNSKRRTPAPPRPHRERRRGCLRHKHQHTMTKKRRIMQLAPSDRRLALDIMRKRGDKYPCFQIAKDWINYRAEIKDEKQGAKFFLGILRYGLNEEEPQGLTGDVAKYFAEVVKPDLDRQHEQIRKEVKL